MANFVTKPATVEAQQFKGVKPYPDGLTDAQKAAIPPQPFDNTVSMKFSDGTMFDVQSDDAGQYLVLSVKDGRRRVNVGDWIVQIGPDSFIRLTDEEFAAQYGEEK